MIVGTLGFGVSRNAHAQVDHPHPPWDTRAGAFRVWSSSRFDVPVLHFSLDRSTYYLSLLLTYRPHIALSDGYDHPLTRVTEISPGPGQSCGCSPPSNSTVSSDLVLTGPTVSPTPFIGNKVYTRIKDHEIVPNSNVSKAAHRLPVSLITSVPRCPAAAGAKARRI